MDISSDAVRRAVRAIDAEHRLDLSSTAETIDRLYQDEAPAQVKWDLVTGGANRATWTKVGGVAVLTSAVLAACGDQSPAPPPATTAPPEGATTTLPGGSRLGPNDLMILRFGASVENLAVATYERVLPLLTTATAQNLAKVFQTHHKDHAELFNGQLSANAQKEFTEPNNVLLASFKPRLDALVTEADALKLAQELEVAAASTYLSTVGVLEGEKLGYTAMSIGATEYRHAALLAYLTNTPIAANRGGFLTVSQAIAPVGV